MKYLFVILFVLIYIFFDVSLGYTTNSPMYAHLTFMFQHAGFIHLTINSLSFLSIFRILEKCISKYYLVIIIVSSSYIASFLSVYDTPTVGASGMVYAMIGIYIVFIAKKRLIIKDKDKFSIFLISVALCLALSYFKTNSNFFMHLYSLLIGMVSAVIMSIYQTTGKI